jgi:hypothetical protein
MARHKRPPHPLLRVARAYLAEHAPALQDAPMTLRQLDGPPKAPRFAITVEACQAQHCPHDIPLSVSSAGKCPVPECNLRCTMRLLYDRRGTMRTATQSTVHWGEGSTLAVEE